MPYSSTEGKEQFIHFFDKLKPTQVIDVGPGAGNYAKIIRQMGKDVPLVGVEIWAPYIKQFELEKLYTKVVVSDVRYVNWSAVGHTDVGGKPLFIFGDILEHMPAVDAKWVLVNAIQAPWRQHSGAIWLSVPIVHYPQGEHEGNPYEAHVVDDWTHEKVLAFLENVAAEVEMPLNVVGHVGQEIGSYEITWGKT